MTGHQELLCLLEVENSVASVQACLFFPSLVEIFQHVPGNGALEAAVNVMPRLPRTW